MMGESSMSAKNMIITIGRQYGSGGHEIGRKIADELGIRFYDEQIIDSAAVNSKISEDKFCLEKKVIQNAARESCVIVGSCANIVLGDIDKSLAAFIYAPIEYRIQRVRDLYLSGSTEEAIAQIRRVDKNRRNYYQYYTDYEWGTHEGHDILIDSSTYGIDGTARILVDLAKIKYEALRAAA